MALNHDYRRLQESAINETYSEGDDFVHDETGADEGDIIIDTLKVYGSMFLVLFTLFLFLRRKYPRYFNVRSWSPKIRCQLADDQHGIIRWMWELYKVGDDVILEQCGMDSLCFLRALYFGVKLSLMGIVNAIWLMPIYATSDTANEAPSRLVQVSTSYVPPGSNRFYATVVASYVMFIFAMYLILNEFRWFTKWRHVWLMRKRPNNYCVYVTGIPQEYRSSYALKEYFRQCFSKEGVLEAHVAMELPDLDRKVRQRKTVLQKLEHAIALERLRGIVTVHQSIHLSSGKLEQKELVDVYEDQLLVLNEEIRDSIRKIKFKNDRMQDVFERSRATRSRLSDEGLEDEEEEQDELTNMDWKAYRNFKLFPLTAPTSDDSPNIRRRRLSTIDSLPNSPFSMGSNSISSGDHSYIEDYSRDDIETGVRIETDPSMNMDDRQDPSPLQIVHDESSQNVGIFQSDPSILSPQDPSAVFANMFFGAPFSPASIPRGEQEVASKEVPIDVVVDETSDNVLPMDEKCSARDDGVLDETMESDMPANENNVSADEVTISPTKSRDDEQFNCATDAMTFPSNLDGRRNQPCTPDFHSESRATVITQDSIASSLLSEHDSDVSNLVSPTESERSNKSRRSLRQIAKLPQDVSLRASKVVKDGSGKMKRVVVDGSDQVSKAVRGSSQQMTKVVKGSSQQVGKVVKGSSQQVTKVVKDGSQHVSKVVKEVNPENIKKATGAVTDLGVKGAKKATNAGYKGAKKATNAGVSTMVDLKSYVFGNGDGTPRDAGFVVFSKLSTTHAALQMIHHPDPYVMDVEAAPLPSDIYWKNVGMPHKAKQMGKLTSLGLSGLLCLTWTFPVSFISSLTEVDALRESVPFIDNMLTNAPWMEAILGMLAPLLLLCLNGFLPVLLRFISTFEGHISAAVLEASLFQKVAAFQIIQTFFVSAISGSIWAELSNILRNPEELIDLLARSLPAQSTYFIQYVLVDTFVRLSLELLRVLPLSLALLRRCIGPNLTSKERNTPFMWLHPLDEPWDFQMAEIFGEAVLYFVVLFVYAPIAPITCFFLLFCWLLLGSCYRHQFFYNCVSLDSGGAMWMHFINVCLGCMLIAELTLVGMLALKKAPIQSLLMIPLLIMTVLFNFYIGMGKHTYVTKHLPTRLCLQLDRKHHANGGLDFSFVRQKYLQPSLLAQEVHSSRSEERQTSRALNDGSSEISRASSRRVSAIRIRV